MLHFLCTVRTVPTLTTRGKVAQAFRTHMLATASDPTPIRRGQAVLPPARRLEGARSHNLLHGLSSKARAHF